MTNFIPSTYNPQNSFKLNRLPPEVFTEIRGRLESTAIMRINLGYRRNGGGLAASDAHVLWVVDRGPNLIAGARPSAGPPVPVPNGIEPQQRTDGGAPPVLEVMPFIIAQGFTRTSNQFLVKIAYPYFAASGSDWVQDLAVMDGAGQDYFNTNINGKARWYWQNRTPEDQGTQNSGQLGPMTGFNQTQDSFPYWYPIGGADAQQILGTTVLDNLSSCCALDNFESVPLPPIPS